MVDEPFQLPIPIGEEPVYQITNPVTGDGLRIWSNGRFTGRQPPEGEPAILINRMHQRAYAAYADGFKAGQKAAPLLRAVTRG